MVYKPEDLDAHSEWASADGLFDALVDHVRAGDRSIYFQHGHVSDVGFKKAGEWVALAPWPYEVKASFMNSQGKAEKRTVPADSIWMGVIWEPWAWEKVKSVAKFEGCRLVERQSAKKTVMCTFKGHHLMPPLCCARPYPNPTRPCLTPPNLTTP